MRNCWRYILVCAVVLAVALPATPDDYVDDVYFWEQTTLPSAQPINREATETLPRVNEPQNKVQVIFIEDSLTQHCDTVVKAIIRR